MLDFLGFTPVLDRLTVESAWTEKTLTMDVEDDEDPVVREVNAAKLIILCRMLSRSAYPDFLIVLWLNSLHIIHYSEVTVCSP